MNYYNDNDLFCCAWVEELIRVGAIPPGIVDCKDIRELCPEHLKKYNQVHLFCGIGVWAYALQQVGWDVDRPVWTLSCPCQPFSPAGKRKGIKDERHLWPTAFVLIDQCRPVTLFGEQVSGKGGLAWLDALYLDLEGIGYTVGSVDIPACGFGAPHKRNRLYFVAQSSILGRRGRGDGDTPGDGGEVQVEGRGGVGPVAIPDGEQEHAVAKRGLHAESGECCDVDDAKGAGRGIQYAENNGEADAPLDTLADTGDSAVDGCRPGIGPVNGFWRNAEWLPCRDGKARPVEPGTFPLVDGTPAGLVRGGDSGEEIDADNTAEARVMRLRGYGNSLVSEVAIAFISAYMDLDKTNGVG